MAIQKILLITTIVSAIGYSNIALSSQTDKLAPENQCSTKAYVADFSEKGLNIRRQPNSSGKVLGRLPKNTKVNLLGVQGNWILISVVDPSAQRVTFLGEGWVYNSLLGVDTTGYGQKSVNLYSRPSLRSKVSAKIPADSSMTIISCAGRWLKVETKNHQQKGWLEPNQQCSAAETSCS
jgi:uncharacterized protein YgiM (DUF1202 family)